MLKVLSDTSLEGVGIVMKIFRMNIAWVKKLTHKVTKTILNTPSRHLLTFTCQFVVYLETLPLARLYCVKR